MKLAGKHFQRCDRAAKTFYRSISVKGGNVKYTVVDLDSPTGDVAVYERSIPIAKFIVELWAMVEISEPQYEVQVRRIMNKAMRRVGIK